MGQANLTLSLLADTLSICRLEPEEDIPAWALAGNFFSITRTTEELSLVCPQEAVPRGTRCEKGYRCLKVEGPLDFSLSGILASLTLPLSQTGISVFAISTFDTDYLLVRDTQMDSAVQQLSQAGHHVVQ